MNVPLWSHAAGLLFCYSLYGILQEKIFKSEYGPERERFTSSSLLILVNRLFSISTALAIVAFQRCYRRHRHRQAGEHDDQSGATSTTTFWAQVRPHHALSAYGAVSTCNFLSSSCQYEALKYVSYTSQSLAKCAKMIPVILIASCFYGKKHQTRDWVAVAVVSLGCFTYILASAPASARIVHTSSASSEDATSTDDDDGPTFWTSLVGTLLLCGYLFFDGLVSTTQERFFGKNKDPSAPFGPSSPVLDQMIWVNAFAAVIAFVTALASHSAGALLPNLGLMLTSPALLSDVLVFSFVAACGLVVLLNTIAGFGALVSSTIMTVRQFLSIVVNAGIFGNFGQISIEGWIGVGWVASGVYIKMNKGVDEKNDKSSAANEPLLGQDSSSEKDSDSPRSGGGARRCGPVARQYFLPVLVPVALGIICTPLISFSSSFPRWSLPSAPFLQGYHVTESSPSTLVATAHNFTVEGGGWAEQINALIPDDACPDTLESVPHRLDGSRGTAFASYPRSGNSYVRSLIERATGYQTSSVYCDRALETVFKGECNHKANFFVKTHYPALGRTDAHYWDRFDKIVTVVRNPLDAVASYLQFRHVPRNFSSTAHDAHEAKVLDYFGAELQEEVEFLTNRWLSHARELHDVVKPKHFVRYEDIRDSPVTQVMGMLTFMLPEDERPPLARVACIARQNDHLEAYKSRKSRPFSSWDKWDPEVRQVVLDMTEPWFCYWGFDQILAQERGAEAVPEGFCTDAKLRSARRIR